MILQYETGLRGHDLPFCGGLNVYTKNPQLPSMWQRGRGGDLARRAKSLPGGYSTIDAIFTGRGGRRGFVGDRLSCQFDVVHELGCHSGILNQTPALLRLRQKTVVAAFLGGNIRAGVRLISTGCSGSGARGVAAVAPGPRRNRILPLEPIAQILAALAWEAGATPLPSITLNISTNSLNTHGFGRYRIPLVRAAFRSGFSVL